MQSTVTQGWDINLVTSTHNIKYKFQYTKLHAQNLYIDYAYNKRAKLRINVTKRRFRWNILQWKSISITYSDCVFVAKGMSHIVICSLSSSTILSYIISLTPRFSGKTLLNIKYVLWLSLQGLFQTFLILRRIQRDQVINSQTFHVK